MDTDRQSRTSCRIGARKGTFCASAMQALGFRALTSAFLLLALVGCQTTVYLPARARDAGDIFALALGVGGGAKVRSGPVRLGLLYQVDMHGYRYGSRLRNLSGEGWYNRMDIALLTMCLENYDSGHGREESARGKRFSATMGFPGLRPPKDFWSSIWTFVTPLSTLDPTFSRQRDPLFHPYYTQCEVCVGLLGTLRLGANPGELVDFLLGWVGVDFFDDDHPLAGEDDRAPKTGETEMQGKGH